MKDLSISQKILLVALYALILISVILTALATKNVGQTGFDKCISDKCDKKGQEYCTKAREIDNCCKGAGGSLGVQDDQYVCVF
ncbi:MAG TPA: hypothetical protein VJH97_03570 [Candidatus Nanoarchaeia archaeon]|nr:hypothetical protein [Candidatus Nanoarchaeia archaeon]